MQTPDVMVIDDELHICTMIAGYLEKYDLKVIYATSVSEAEELLVNNTPRLIFCDYNMPGKSGFDFLADVKNRQPPLKVVMLTGHAEHDKLMEALNLGVVDYISKPF